MSATLTAAERHSRIDQGDAVYFDRAVGWERGEVWALGMEEVAVSIGESPTTGNPIERTMLDLTQVRTEREMIDLGVMNEEGEFLCEICEEEPSETLTGDGHPEGPNLLVCSGCSR